MNSIVLLELTTQEIVVLRQLIDIAVQAKGLAVAEAGLILNKKLADAMAPKPAQTLDVPSQEYKN